MAELHPLAYASLTASNSGEHATDVEKASRVPLAWLEIESLTFGEFKQVVRVPFHRGQIIRIGRDSKNCNLRFQNKAVSLVHCEIYSILFDKDARYPPLIYVRDCQSTSGTYVNGQLVGEQPFVTAARLLENNDTISIGPCSVRLCDYIVPSAESALSAFQQKEATQFADQFEIKDTILGNGAFASVYLAVNVKTNQQVVCKIHNLSSLSDRYESIAQRVGREMSIWSQLDHPNIVAFHRAFQTNSTMFTFGDLATGGDLFSLLERERSIPELEIKWIVVQVLRAINYLHCKGVAHRDIKPENILCSSSVHMHHRIVVADFGCAGVTSLGRLTSNVGTDIYRAPEAQLSRKPHGIAVDIWAIGVLVLQLLSGYQPVEPFGQSCTELDIEKLVVFVNLRRAGRENGPISQNGIDFILACLSPQPLARPTAAEAAKHVWLRESVKEELLFKEREKQLVWKPRGIIIPAIVRLPDTVQDSSADEQPPGDECQETPIEKIIPTQSPRSSADQGEYNGQSTADESIPNSVQDSQNSDIHQQRTAWPKKRGDTMIGVKRSFSLMNCRSTSVA